MRNGRLTRGPGLIYSAARSFCAQAGWRRSRDPVFSLNRLWDRMLAAKGGFTDWSIPAAGAMWGGPTAIPLAEDMLKRGNGHV